MKCSHTRNNDVRRSSFISDSPFIFHLLNISSVVESWNICRQIFTMHISFSYHAIKPIFCCNGTLIINYHPWSCRGGVVVALAGGGEDQLRRRPVHFGIFTMKFINTRAHLSPSTSDNKRKGFHSPFTCPLQYTIICSILNMTGVTAVWPRESREVTVTMHWTMRRQVVKRNERKS